MVDMQKRIVEALTSYMELMRSEEYFEAHEVLEEVWHPLRRSGDTRRDIVRGYINAAVSFEHIKRDRGDVKSKALTTMSAYERYKDFHHESVELERLFGEMEELVERIKGQYPDIYGEVTFR
jgi:uncharacterized protein